VTAEPKRVFISHIHEEAPLGAAVKAVIEDAFSGHGVTAFLSSDIQDNPAGRKWVQVITGELDQARVLVSLISPTSLRRPWVNIELGAGWIKGRHIIPLCHSGQRVGDLPRPFGDFNGVGLDQDDAAERLLGGVADGFGLSHPRRLAFREMLEELRAAAVGAAAGEPEVAKAKPVPTRTAGPDLAPEQVAILRYLAEQLNRGAEYTSAASAIRGANLAPAVFQHHQKQLSLRRFTSSRTSPTRYSITPDGSGWLIAHGQMPRAPAS
jgi:hypothetical protein